MTEEQEKMHCCDAMVGHLANQDLPLAYSPRFREYGLRILDGGSAIQLIGFCPWCGRRLPDPLREEWFERLEQLSLEPGDSRIPEEMKTDAWWRAAADLPASTSRH